MKYFHCKQKKETPERLFLILTAVSFIRIHNIQSHHQKILLQGICRRRCK